MYAGARPWGFKSQQQHFKMDWNSTGSQCKEDRIGLICTLLLPWVKSRAAAFWIVWRQTKEDLFNM